MNYTRHYGSHGPSTHEQGCCGAHYNLGFPLRNNLDALSVTHLHTVPRYCVKCIAAKRGGKKNQHNEDIIELKLN